MSLNAPGQMSNKQKKHASNLEIKDAEHVVGGNGG